MRACAASRRTPSNSRAWSGPAHRFLILLALLLLSGAQAISYTVQVVAVSEQESALSVQRTLLNEAYPAYVVRASTGQGDIYRVRVGAFGNRDAALLFARTMPVVAGSPPLPALAEGIPAAVMPLEPRLLLDMAAPVIDIVPWGESVALRMQEEPTTPATYLLVAGESPASFEAWRAAPTEGGVLRLRNLSLWPETWESDVPEAREAYRTALLTAIAGRFGMSPAALEELQGRPVFGPPYLVVLEMVVGGPAGETTILGIARPGSSGYGPSDLVIGTGPLPEVPGPLYRASPESPPLGEEFRGEGWSVRSADEFFLLSTEESSRGWRAGVGVPLWSDGEYLLTRGAGKLLLYDFVSR